MTEEKVLKLLETDRKLNSLITSLVMNNYTVEVVEAAFRKRYEQIKRKY